MTAAILLLVALVGLVAGSDLAVAGAKRIAWRWGIPPVVIGLTVTSIGTSLPEIATNVAAAVSTGGGVDASGLAVGNIIGSNLFLVTLLLGLAAVVAPPLQIPELSLKRDGTMLVAAMLAMFIACIDGQATRFEGVLLTSAYLGYLGFLGWQIRTGAEAVDESERMPEGTDVDMRVELGRLAAGFVLVVFCADVAVDQGVLIAERLGFTATVIGLWVGFGTGFPELVIAVRAAMANEDRMALGNMIGSAITNPLLCFGLGAIVHPVTVSPTNLQFDFAFWIAATGVALLLLIADRDVNRTEGGVLLILFALYVYVRMMVVG